MSGEEHPYKETAKATPLLAIWVVIAVALCILGTSLWLGYEKHYQNQQTSITRQTNQYLTSAQQHLVQLRADYAALDTQIATLGNDPASATVVDGLKGQQRATLVEMRKQAAVLQPDQVPPDIAAFLSQHPYA